MLQQLKFYFGYNSHSVKIKSITPAIKHAASPFYDHRTNTLYYVDVFKATVYRYDLYTKERTSYRIEHRSTIGVVVPVWNTEDEFIVAADRFIYKLRWSDCPDIKPILRSVLMVERQNRYNVFGEGRIDREGRLWIGTHTRNDNLSVTPQGGSLYVFDGRNIQNYAMQMSDISISNGMVWSRDNKKLYFVDSMYRVVFGFDYDKRGKISNRRIVFDMMNHRNLKGTPDGMTMDVYGNLWIALFGGRAVISVDPYTSKLLRVIEMPATYITSLCFGGLQGDVLYVTSSRIHSTPDEIRWEPLSGSVFAVTKLETSGLSPITFNCKKFWACNE